jgi:hypothetical protein
MAAWKLPWKKGWNKHGNTWINAAQEKVRSFLGGKNFQTRKVLYDISITVYGM